MLLSGILQNELKIGEKTVYLFSYTETMESSSWQWTLENDLNKANTNIQFGDFSSTPEESRWFLSS